MRLSTRIALQSDSTYDTSPTTVAEITTIDQKPSGYPTHASFTHIKDPSTLQIIICASLHLSGPPFRAAHYLTSQVQPSPAKSSQAHCMTSQPVLSAVAFSALSAQHASASSGGSAPWPATTSSM